MKALDLAGADLPLDGQLIVAAPGQIPAATQGACIGSGVVPLATWVMVLTAAGQTLQVPTYLLTTHAALAQIGPAVHRDLLAASGRSRRNTRPRDVRSQGLQRRAHDQRRLLAGRERRLGLRPGCRTRRARASRIPRAQVIAPAAIAPGAMSLSAKRSGPGATLAGAVTQAGQARGGASVTIFGGSARQPGSSGSARRRWPRTASSRSRPGPERSSAPTRSQRAGRHPRCARSSAAPRRHPVRQPDGERVRREEQGRQEEVATSHACAGAGPRGPAPVPRVSYGWYCWSIESTGFGYLSPTRIQ